MKYISMPPKAKKDTKKSTKPNAKKPVSKSSNKPVSKSSNQSASKSSNKPVSKSSNKPVFKSSKPSNKSSSKKERPLAEKSDDAPEIIEIKNRRDNIIGMKPNDVKWAEQVHMACAGLYKCYKYGERDKCIKEIHDKLDKLEK
jgi:hypothetical protein